MGTIILLVLIAIVVLSVHNYRAVLEERDAKAAKRKSHAEDVV